MISLLVDMIERFSNWLLSRSALERFLVTIDIVLLSILLIVLENLFLCGVCL